jgi:hypothetical protein
MMKIKVTLGLVFILLTIYSPVKGQTYKPTEVPEFFSQSFGISKLTSPVYNSLSASYVGDARLLFISDKSRTPFNVRGKFKLWSVDLITQKSKIVNTKDLCEIDRLKYNVNAITVDDSNSFMIASINDEAFNDFLAETRFTLLHVDLSHGFSQCAVPPFVKIGYSYVHPFYDDLSGYLYFASDMPGGRGGLDIYRVEKIGANDWGDIEPLDVVNTPNNDIYPFVSDQGDFYFSTLTASTGYDVYIVDLNKARAPTRLPSPINSRVDDFNFIIISEKDAIIARSSSSAESTVLYRMVSF